jgi:protocatechuate 3,4-dioxygenase beta subunit
VSSALLITLIVALLQGTSQTAQPSPHGTSEISGRVTDAQTGRPIARAVVQLGRIDELEPMFARTDEQGRYRFSGLAPGEYIGGAGVNSTVNNATYVASVFPRGARRLMLREGEVRDNVDVALQRARAIVTRVVNEWGDPLAHVTIDVRSIGGANSSAAARAHSTDDRGRARLFGATPGRYVVCAVPPPFGWGVNRATGNHYLKTCYPSALSETDAEPVDVERADAEIEIRIRRGRTFTISGTVLDASGAPAASANVSISNFNRAFSTSTLVDDSGRFSIAGVPPGEYFIETTVGGPQQPELRRDAEHSLQQFRVDGADVEGLVISLEKTVTVAGRIVPEDPTVPFNWKAGDGPIDGPIYVGAALADVHLPGVGVTQTAFPVDDRTFILSGLFGRRVLEVGNVPRGWYVKAIRYHGEDILDVPVQFKSGTQSSDLQIIVSTRGARVSGRVIDDRGDPVRGAPLMLLQADRPQPTVVQSMMATSAATGAYRLGPVRGGDYFVVALPPSASWPDLRDAATLKRVTESAERITLADEEQRSMDVRLKGKQ